MPITQREIADQASQFPAESAPLRKYPASFRHIVEHDAIDLMACIEGSASVVIDDVLPGRGPQSRDRPQCRVDPRGESPSARRSADRCMDKR